MTDYKGGAGDEARILALEKQREMERKNRQREMEKIAAENRKPKVIYISYDNGGYHGIIRYKS